MSEPAAKGVADKVTQGVEKDLTGRATNEPRLQSEGRGDKLKGDAETAGSAAKDLSGSAASKTQDDLNRD